MDASNTADTPENLSDEELLCAIGIHGDRSAFINLFQRYAGRIKGFLIRGGAAHDVAEEVAQDVMVTIWRKASSFDPVRASAATWIFTIARNRRVDLIRRERRAEPDPDDPIYNPGPADSAESETARSGRDAHVRGALDRLNEDQREIVMLAYYAGLSQSDIAVRLEVPLGTVKSRIRLAFARLRSELGDEFSQELMDD
ncbi:MAG: sigma-70 family RNA polymerase sigma factor [Pseudomonadota bacterium]